MGKAGFSDCYIDRLVFSKGNRFSKNVNVLKIILGRSVWQFLVAAHFDALS